MDQRFNAIIKKLQNNQKQSNLADFWNDYLTHQKNALEESIANVKKYLEIIMLMILSTIHLLPFIF